MLLVLFGLPGAGKTFVGKIFQKEFGFFLHDADVDLPKDMKNKILRKETITDNMRNRFFNRIIKQVNSLSQRHTKLVVAQTFIKERYRQKVLDAFPSTYFLLITASSDIRARRLLFRKEFPLNLDYVKKMNTFFEEPQIPHLVIDNNKDGKVLVEEQIQILLKQFSEE